MGRCLFSNIRAAKRGQIRAAIARLDSTTGLADTFNPRLSNWLPRQCWVYSIAVQADGKILAGGNFDHVGADPSWNTARFDATTGSPDGFHSVMNYPVYSIAVQTGGAILAGGYFTNVGGQMRNRIAQLDATTGFAYSFDPNANSFVESTSQQAE